MYQTKLEVNKNMKGNFKSKFNRNRYILVGMIILLSVSSATAIVDKNNVELTLDVLETVRNPVEYPGYINVNYLGNSTDEITLKYIEIDWGNKKLSKINLNKQLKGIGKENAKIRDLEKPDAKISKTEVEEISKRLSEGMYNELITINTKDIFKNDWKVNKNKNIKVKLAYKYENKENILETSSNIKIVPSIVGSDMIQSLSTEDISRYRSYYLGDLHLHSAYSSWAGYDQSLWTWWDGCPELPIIYGYSIPQLKSISRALGYNWFSITDHSYCLNNDRFNNVKYESSRYSDSTFLILPSEELSVQDVGSLPNIAHLGAHNLYSFIPGGIFGDMNGQNAINRVNYQNGFAIINHPTPLGDLFGWNDYSVVGEKGVEIWNGNYPSNDNINFWKNRLLKGFKTFAFSGTDSHGRSITGSNTNVAYIPGIFDKTSLDNAIKNGHNFVSNGPFLTMESIITYPGNMGDTLYTNGNIPVILLVHVNPQSKGDLAIYKGVIGANSEVYDGLWPIRFAVDGPDTLALGFYPYENSYYRLEYRSNDGTGFNVFTNPIFVYISDIIIDPATINSKEINKDINITVKYGNAKQIKE